VLVALAATAKAITSYRIGKRDGANTVAFLTDLRERVLGKPELSSDAFRAYREAVEMILAWNCDYGQIIKTYVGEPARDAARRYSPGVVLAVDREVISGARPSSHFDQLRRAAKSVVPHGQSSSDAFDERLFQAT